MRHILVVLLALSSVFAMLFEPVSAPGARPLIYVSPSPDGRNISPATSLAFREGSPFDQRATDARFFSVVGSKSGVHSGSVRLSDDRLTLVYYPSRPFAFAEIVAVAVRPGLTTAAGIPIAVSHSDFSTLEHPMAPQVGAPQLDGFPLLPATQHVAPQQSTPRYYTYPEFSNAMTTTVTTPAQGTADGYVFVASSGITPGADPGLLVIDNTGEPIYLQRTPNGMLATDFKKQIVNGTSYLTYHTGVPSGSWTNGTYDVMDSSYSVVDSWTIGNGYGADLHDMQLLDNGHALLASYVPIPADLSAWGGPVDGVVIDTVIQEQDSTKNVVFEWHGSDHVALTDTYQGLNSSPVDFMHTNAIDVDLDGNLLISCRSLSQVIKINRQTGQVIWRLGGRSNQFTFTNDGGFSYQHDIRRLPDGHITIFDNGNQHHPPFSRGLEYQLDEGAKTATLTWQYQQNPTTYAAFMGNVQRLSNGSSLIGWGAVPQVTEVRPDGAKALELALGGLTYRAFRFTWDALPAELPRAALTTAGDPTGATLYSSWNGATRISGYEIYTGATPDAMSLLTTISRTGFETAATLTGLDPATCVFKIHPVQQLGATTPFSANIYRMDQPACRALLNIVYFPTATVVR
jgi:hypothetical protein